MFPFLRNHPLYAGRLAVLACGVALAGACTKQEGGPTPPGSPDSSAPKAAANEFEGEVQMKIETAAGQQMLMTYLIKGGRTRVETEMPGNPEAGAVMLWDLEDGKITTLMPQRKVYMIMDLKVMGESLRGLREKSAARAEQARLGKPTPTGKRETIAGYECEHWLIKNEQEVDMCVARGMGFFGMGNSPFATDALKSLNLNPKSIGDLADDPEWAKFVEGGAFPLKVTVLKEGRTEFTMEATRIERKTLDDSLFAVPPDYREMNMPNAK